VTSSLLRHPFVVVQPDSEREQLRYAVPNERREGWNTSTVRSDRIGGEASDLLFAITFITVELEQRPRRRRE
jgi:hypothetical protein